MKMRAIAAVAMLLGGCATAQSTITPLNRVWDGKASDGFFIRHGPPISIYNLTTGEKLCTWDSGTGPFSAGPHRCVVQVRTTNEGIIEDIRLMSDTTGLYELSRFHELFSADFTPSSDTAK